MSNHEANINGQGVHFDFSQITELAAGDMEFLTTLMGDILKQTRQMSGIFEEYLASGDWDALSKAAHKFKSVTQFFGDNPLFKTIHEIEVQASARVTEKLAELVADSKLYGQILVTQAEQLLSEIN